MITKRNRTILIIASSTDIVIGFFVGRFFPDPLGISGAGLTILFIAWIINACLAMHIYKSEARQDKE
jgi:Na+-driven multidrug efflux pump